jgi:hypothetical protein
MPFYDGARPPVSCCWLIRMASRLAPAPARLEWRARHEAGLIALCVLVDRGAVAGDGHLAAYCRESLHDALRQRFGAERVRAWSRSAACVPAVAAAVLLIAGLLSGGFPATRRLARITCSLYAEPLRGDADALVVHGIPLAFGLMVGAVLVAIRRLPLHRYGWRYWSFLGLKTAATVTLVPVLWFEGVAALRRALPGGGPRDVLPAMLLTLAFIVAFACALAWSFADQRRRCPVCLRLLGLPVTMGRWSSVLEPAATELVCHGGHGCLCVPETECGLPARWTAMDSSWR